MFILNNGLKHCDFLVSKFWLRLLLFVSLLLHNIFVGNTVGNMISDIISLYLYFLVSIVVVVIDGIIIIFPKCSSFS